MKNKALILGTALLIFTFAASSLAFAGDGMSNVQHRKTMGGGLHHPASDQKNEESEDKKEPSRMSDVQHKKHMGGLKHPEDGQKGAEGKGAHPMSDVQHRKTMGGGLKHPTDENRQ